MEVFSSYCGAEGTWCSGAQKRNDILRAVTVIAALEGFRAHEELLYGVTRLLNVTAYLKQPRTRDRGHAATLKNVTFVWGSAAFCEPLIVKQLSKQLSYIIRLSELSVASDVLNP